MYISKDVARHLGLAMNRLQFNTCQHVNNFYLTINNSVKFNHILYRSKLLMPEEYI